ncbi:type II toxin-antitoxin system Phd/YefM family antitoxin [Trichococcus ilyis]|uniref:Antitoxin Phd_YefM, type II toxin-antitoxin system n=1 Tax=Trichococcus ilyis TaxID=640938 RepID=A0A143YP38_9LACT|nr:type II toxin-antitoxin system Phd/YefM family antitoxin [Trichococcus ilyis]CZQ95506.1 type ii toxin-antitoxin system antitoxin phd/yefm [Trichococcus ilyis]SEJ06966.1 Antitoxin Phd_YefM, type II toxin-antitoxin system [Trichococcus ilyis]
MSFKILDVPTTSISEVKKSPTIIFKKAEKENTPVYVFNRGDVAGVMLTQEQYESLTNEIEVLHEQVMDLVVAQRLAIKDLELFSDEEVRGTNADQFLTIDENDGWE